MPRGHGHKGIQAQGSGHSVVRLPGYAEDVIFALRCQNGSFHTIHARFNSLKSTNVACPEHSSGPFHIDFPLYIGCQPLLPCVPFSSPGRRGSPSAIRRPVLRYLPHRPRRGTRSKWPASTWRWRDPRDPIGRHRQNSAIPATGRILCCRGYGLVHHTLRA